MKRLIKVPFLGTNDSDCVLVEWLVPSSGVAKSGQTICALETTKSINDVDAEINGYVYHAAHEGQRLTEGGVLGLIASEPIENIQAAIEELQRQDAPPQNTEVRKSTKKAEILMSRYKLSYETLEVNFGLVTITEELVNRYLEIERESEQRKGFENIERVGVIGGVGGGGALIVLESLFRSSTQQAVAVFDRDTAFHNKTILGVPVVGPIELLWEWLETSRLDKVVIAFNRNLDERRKVFEELKRRGVPFCNVIDPTANIRMQVSFGEGNVILGNVYLGACTQVGNNNFISSNVCLEHGNKLGSHCAFGPAVATSGNVTIGDTVRFGTGIYVEPSVSIGNEAVIASGSIIRSDVPDKAVVKMKYSTITKT